MALKIFSPAKINLFLHIIGKRPDGYHDLQSVFRTLDFGDWLSFDLMDTKKPLITLTGAEGLTKELDQNLIVKAVTLFAKHFPNHAKPIVIDLQKHIPTGAGLGGGSSNCATTLIALNQLWALDLSLQALIDFAKQLGADVPFFIFSHFHQQDAIVCGIGEILTPLKLPSARYLLLFPQAHLSTAQFFSHPDLQKNCSPIPNIGNRYDDYGNTMTDAFINVFEPIAVMHSPAVALALQYLKSLQISTGTTARLTGTGSTVFLPIPDNIDDAMLKHWQAAAPCPTVIAQNLY